MAHFIKFKHVGKPLTEGKVKTTRTNRVRFFVAAAAAALADMPDAATIREATADIVMEKAVLWRKDANRATRLAKKMY